MKNIFKLDEKDIKKLIKWRDGHKEEVRNNRNFAFLEGTIQIPKSNLKVKSKYCYIDFNFIADNKIEFSYGYVADKKVELLSFQYKLLIGSLGRCIDLKTNQILKNINTNVLIEDVIAVFFALNYYAIANKTIKILKPISERKDKTERIKKIGKNSYVTREISLERIIYEGSTGRKNNIPKTVEYHKKEWSVKGFPRHYKNGKVVFIKPSVRKRRIDKNIIIPKEIEETETIYTL